MKFINKKKQLKIEETSRSHVIVFVLAALVILPVALVISTSIQSSHSSTVLSDIESEINSLEREVRNIESKIVETSSLSDVAEEVEKDGFSIPDQLVYIQKENSVASLR